MHCEDRIQHAGIDAVCPPPAEQPHDRDAGASPPFLIEGSKELDVSPAVDRRLHASP